jgi:hypothetical protein
MVNGLLTVSIKVNVLSSNGGLVAKQGDDHGYVELAARLRLDEVIHRLQKGLGPDAHEFEQACRPKGWRAFHLEDSESP